MKGQLAATALIILASNAAHSQTKVANYALGKPGTDKYEQLSFWVKDGKRTDIFYAYGKDRKEVKVAYLKSNKSGFSVQFSNGHTLAITPNGTLLKVTDAAGKAPKTFAWEYEGPVNGIGTFCEPCAADEKEAMQIMRTYYLK